MTPTWTLDNHGDEVERQWCHQVGQRFPMYQTFWQQYVVPQTFRVLEPTLIYLRAGAPRSLKEMAELSYSVFCHLARANEVVASTITLTKGSALLDIFNALYGALESMEAFAAITSKVVGEYGGPQIRDASRRFSIQGDPSLNNDIDGIRRSVGGYRGPLQHTTSFIRIGDYIPEATHVNKYRDLTQLTAVQLTPAIIQSEFRLALDVVKMLIESIEDCANRLFRIVISEFEALPNRDRFLRDLSEPTPVDRELAPQLVAAPLSGWAPVTSGLLTVQPSAIGGIRYDEL